MEKEMGESSCSVLLSYGECFFSGLALYDKRKCFCAEFIADIDTGGFSSRILLFLLLLQREHYKYWN